MIKTTTICDVCGSVINNNDSNNHSILINFPTISWGSHGSNNVCSSQTKLHFCHSPKCQKHISSVTNSAAKEVLKLLSPAFKIDMTVNKIT